MAEGEATIGTEERVPLSCIEYELIQDELKKMRDEFWQEQQKTREMLQTILDGLPPAPPGPWFTFRRVLLVYFYHCSFVYNIVVLFWLYALF